MKQTWHAFPLSVFALCAASAAQQAPAPKPLTFEALRSGQARYRVASPRVRWVDAGRLVEVQLAGGKKKKEVRRALDPRTWEPAKPSGGARDASSDRKPRVSIDRGNGQVRFVDAVGKAKALTEPGSGHHREAHVSPAGTHVSFCRGHDLIVSAVDGSGEWRVTDDGGPDQFHGLLDWVYQEEIYGRGDFQGHWWSPTGGHVAFLSLDEAPVKEFTIVDHVPRRKLGEERAVVTEVSNYPKAGDPNPVVSLSVADVANRTVRKVDLGKFPKDCLVVRVGWSPSGDRVVFQVQDRVQTWLQLCAADPATGEVSTWIREESPTWVNVLGQPDWLADGTFLWWSERTGYKHLYRYRAGGELVGQVTSGEFPARSLVRCDEERGLVWFTGSADFACDAHLFRVGLDGQGQVQLTRGRGTHRVSLNHDGSMFVDRYSNVAMPPEVRVCDADGSVTRTLSSAPVASDYVLCPKEIHSIEARDGHRLDATLIKPHDFDPNGGPYPIWIATYSGPEAPSVRNSWRVSSWHQLLAQSGLLVMQVNVRTASLAGHKYVGLCHKQFCVQELQDLEDAVTWLTQSDWADAARVGIGGWSYGGTMTAYALTHSKLFRLGIAGAGVYDWQLYDTIYTERYMDTPQNNPKGYARSSCLEAAKNLHGYLVLIHGTMDDNVHLQNTIRFAGELQRYGKDFEMMLYPKSRHGVRSPHLQQTRWRVIRRELLGV